MASRFRKEPSVQARFGRPAASNESAAPQLTTMGDGLKRADDHGRPWELSGLGQSAVTPAEQTGEAHKVVADVPLTKRNNRP